MNERLFHRKNHYVPRLALKRFESSPGRVWTYRTLVTHPNVPFWKETSTSAVAYHEHLYTRVIGDHLSDEVERWFDAEFEAPAEDALAKATSDRRLSPDDWRRLVAFLAAQFVRTPSRLLQNLRRWEQTLPAVLQESLERAVREVGAAKDAGTPIEQKPSPNREYVPAKVTVTRGVGNEPGHVRLEAVSGRGMWLFSMRHLLTQRLDILHGHRWTILRAPKDTPWFTSDDPVLMLRFHSPQQFDLAGKWNEQGTEIMLPLSPQHLLYTQVGQRPPMRGETMPREQAMLLRRIIAQNAYRVILSSTRDPEVPVLRSRIVDSSRVREEMEQWSRWHDDQVAAERGDES